MFAIMHKPPSPVIYVPSPHHANDHNHGLAVAFGILFALFFLITCCLCIALAYLCYKSQGGGGGNLPSLLSNRGSSGSSGGGGTSSSTSRRPARYEATPSSPT